MNQDFLDRLQARLEPELRRRDGAARLAEWECEDGHIVIYTTGRVQGSPHDGRFLAQLFTPDGDTGDYTQTTRREFATSQGRQEPSAALVPQAFPKVGRPPGRGRQGGDTVTTSSWDRPYPFDPRRDFPPAGARVHVAGLGDAVFREAGPVPFAHWDVANGIIRPGDDAGIQLATAWALQQGIPTVGLTE